MKKYSQAKGKNKYNWNTTLDQIIKNKGRIARSTHNSLKKRSEQWVTCACGNQCVIIPRDYDGRPLDDVLYNLGVNFHFNIYSAEWDAAKKTLAKIEKRSAQIIKNILAEKKKEYHAAKKKLDEDYSSFLKTVYS